MKLQKLEIFTAIKRRFNVISKNRLSMTFISTCEIKWLREKVARCRWPETLHKIMKLLQRQLVIGISCIEITCWIIEISRC